LLEQNPQMEDCSGLARSGSGTISIDCI
jgi:hypothetical protein